MTTRLGTAPDLSPGDVFWHLSDTAVVADTTSAQIVLWNPAAEQLFGYTAVEAIGMPVDVLVPQGLKSEPRASLIASLGSDGPVAGSERLVRRKNGEEVWVQVTLIAPHVVCVTRSSLASTRSGTSGWYATYVRHSSSLPWRAAVNKTLFQVAVTWTKVANAQRSAIDRTSGACLRPLQRITRHADPRRPHASLAAVDDAGHALPHEQPELLRALLAEWLARLARSD